MICFTLCALHIYGIQSDVFLLNNVCDVVDSNLGTVCSAILVWPFLVTGTNLICSLFQRFFALVRITGARKDVMW